jgi:hypothetical protein
MHEASAMTSAKLIHFESLIILPYPSLFGEDAEFESYGCEDEHEDEYWRKQNESNDGEDAV